MAAKKKYQTYQVGDIFSLELVPGEFAFGRVLLDIYPLFKKRILARDSPLYFGNEHTILVEIFRNIAQSPDEVPAHREVLIPGILTNDIDLLLGKWKVIHHEPVNPLEVDFPEFITHRGAFDSNFVKGEIKVTIPLPHEKTEDLGIYQSELGCRNLNDVVLYSLGRIEEMTLAKDHPEIRNLANMDLRFSARREEILALLPDIFKESYHVIAAEYGFPVERLY